MGSFGVNYRTQDKHACLRDEAGPEPAVGCGIMYLIKSVHFRMLPRKHLICSIRPAFSLPSQFLYLVGSEHGVFVALLQTTSLPTWCLSSPSYFSCPELTSRRHREPSFLPKGHVDIYSIICKPYKIVKS